MRQGKQQKTIIACSVKHEIAGHHFHIHLYKSETVEMGKMFSKNKKLANQEVQTYSQQTQLQPHVIQQIYEAFMDRAGNNGR